MTVWTDYISHIISFAETGMTNSSEPQQWHGTTILTVRKGGKVVVAGDGQVSLGNTVIMITHDVDEAVLLSDRIVMMTNGPAATIGEILEVKLDRPRDRLALAEDPDFVHLRQQVLEFLYAKHSNPAQSADKTQDQQAAASPTLEAVEGECKHDDSKTDGPSTAAA